MSRVRTNVLANVGGKAYVAVVNLVALPIIARLLGYEAYGLVGLYASFQAMMMLLDVGLTATLGRSVAAISAAETPESASELGDVVRTFLVVFVGTGLFGSMILGAASSVIVHHWLKLGSLNPATAQHCIVLMAWMLGAQWPTGILLGVLVALERQVMANALMAAVATLRSFGGVLVLRIGLPTPERFLWWQLSATVAYTIVCWYVVRRALPEAPRRARFDLNVVKSRRHFVGGTALISVLSVAMVQADRIVLSKLLPLDAYGQYVLAATAASSLALVVAPVTQALYPGLVRLVERRNLDELRKHFHLMAQLVSLALLPVAAAITLSPIRALTAWTGDSVLARHVAWPFVLLVVANVANGIMNGPYYLQLAWNSTRITVILNTIAVLVLVPALVVSAHAARGLGAAAATALVSLTYLAGGGVLIIRQFLNGQYFAYAIHDVAWPGVAAVAGATVARFVPCPDSRVAAAVSVAGGACAAFAAAFASLGMTRRWFVATLRALRASR